MEKNRIPIRRAHSRGLLVLLLMLGISAPLLQGENAEKTRWSEKPEKERIEWLSTHTDHPSFFDRLVSEAGRENDPERSIELLERFLPVIEQAERRHRLLKKIASIEEAIGELESAQQHYQSAASTQRGAWDYNDLYASALILIELGDYSLARLQLHQIREKANSTELRHSAALQDIRLLVLEGRQEEARDRLVQISRSRSEGMVDPPPELYLGYSLAVHLEMRDYARKTKELLVKNYPNSPEAGMVQGIVERSASVENVFGLLSKSIETESDSTEVSPEEEPSTEEEEAESDTERPLGIQTGSFRDRENAEYMVKELVKNGFEAKIRSAVVNDSEYHRVFVPLGEDSSQDIILKLKELGYEGYPIY